METTSSWVINCPPEWSIAPNRTGRDRVSVGRPPPPDLGHRKQRRLEIRAEVETGPADLLAAADPMISFTASADRSASSSSVGRTTGW
jgi:hypothetical protein